MHADICHTWLYPSSNMVTWRLKKVKEWELLLLCFLYLKRDMPLLPLYIPFTLLHLDTVVTLALDWRGGPYTEAFGRNLLFQLRIMSLICIFLVYLMSLIFSFRRAMFEFSAVHCSLFQFPTYLPIFYLVTSSLSFSLNQWLCSRLTLPLWLSVVCSVSSRKLI